MLNIVYVLEYEIILNFNSMESLKKEIRREYFKRNERDMFMERYFELKDKYYIENLVSYYAELIEVSVEAMANII